MCRVESVRIFVMNRSCRDDGTEARCSSVLALEALLRRLVVPEGIWLLLVACMVQWQLAL